MAKLMEPMVHARFDGRSEELTLKQLSLAQNANDQQIKHALAGYFDLPKRHLDDHVVVRTSQAIIVRPEAIYG